MSMDPRSIEGFYAAYLTGGSGHSVVLIALKSTTLIGVDIAGGQYDGSYEPSDQSIGVKLDVMLPPNVSLLQGGQSGHNKEKHRFEFNQPFDFAERPFIRVEGKAGPINVRFVKLRDFND